MQLIAVHTVTEAVCSLIARYCLLGQGFNAWGIQWLYLAVGSLDLIMQQPLVVGPFFLHDIVAKILNLLLYGAWTCSYITKYQYPDL